MKGIWVILITGLLLLSESVCTPTYGSFFSVVPLRKPSHSPCSFVTAQLGRFLDTVFRGSRLGEEDYFRLTKRAQHLTNSSREPPEFPITRAEMIQWHRELLKLGVFTFSLTSFATRLPGPVSTHDFRRQTNSTLNWLSSVDYSGRILPEFFVKKMRRHGVFAFDELLELEFSLLQRSYHFRFSTDREREPAYQGGPVHPSAGKDIFFSARLAEQIGWPYLAAAVLWHQELLHQVEAHRAQVSSWAASHRLIAVTGEAPLLFDGHTNALERSRFEQVLIEALIEITLLKKLSRLYALTAPHLAIFQSKSLAALTNPRALVESVLKHYDIPTSLQDEFFDPQLSVMSVIEHTQQPH